MAAPAFAAAIEDSAISSGVTGRYGDMDGVWIAPVGAHVMMTLRVFAMMVLSVIGMREIQSVSTLPHTDSACPEIALPAGELRNSTLAATSSCVTMRRSEIFSR